MRGPFEQLVLEKLRRERLLSPGDRVVVAVSGGADSVALLRLLQNLRHELGIGLAVVHFDHMLRGAESGADAVFVAGLARAANLEFLLAREDVAAAAARNRWNLEEAGRRLRYAFFQQLVAQGRATRVAVAHTADDQAETVLARLVRGTGPAGLAGIFPSAGCVVRPLLWARRQALRSYLQDIGQHWREDPTNYDESRLRARIRGRLLPALARDFSPSVPDHLAELARFAREEEVFWDALIEDRFRALVRPARGGFEIPAATLISPLQFAGAASQPLPPEIQRPVTERLIRCLYKEIRGDSKGVAARHVDQVIHLATHPGAGRVVALPRGVFVRRDFGVLTFSRPAPAKCPQDEAGIARDRALLYAYPVTLANRGETIVSVPELGTCFLLKVFDWPLPERDTSIEGEALGVPNVLDADLIGGALILRNWRPGDAYRPRGSRSCRKLKDLFQAGRVAAPLRRSWPVLESAGRIVWARGMPVADEFFARENTRAGVVIREDRLEPS